ncbi:MAG: hypothetical protein FWG02_03225 [Holophagaceae bacterium]|nr:hypothetical protein [Holophagaceae bacterium]
MSVASPLIFRASPIQRAIAMILGVGCLLVLGRGVPLIAQNIPRMWYQLRLAQSQSMEPTTMIWLGIVSAIIAILLGGIILVLTILILVQIEGTQIIVDGHGIAVKCTLLPYQIAKRFGAGHITWKDVSQIERRGIFFVLIGFTAPKQQNRNTIIKFFVVDQMEQLICLIIERSPNLKLNS